MTDAWGRGRLFDRCLTQKKTIEQEFLFANFIASVVLLVPGACLGMFLSLLRWIVDAYCSEI